MDIQNRIRLVLIALPITFILALLWHPLGPLPALLILYLGILLRQSGFFDTLFTRRRPPVPYYQPSQQAAPAPPSDPVPQEDEHHEPRYQQGYQAQVLDPPPVHYEHTGQPTQGNVHDYEQPEAQYPEQMPPMPTI
jgi:hypothetical protein